MASSSENNDDRMSDLYANMTIDEKDIRGLIVDDVYIGSNLDDYQCCLVGRFLTERNIHFNSMQNTLASL
ncbi:hypothetical protein PTKIN_Ptkin01aG0274500 [Pterospermum kingtungense]